jgi:outer membrane protein insertion porin family
MDRGFADFRADDVQVAISPDKRDIFVTISVTEGDRYTIADVKLAGDMVVPEQELEGLMLAQPGQTFSQAVLTQSEELMAFRLGQDGYAFAEIRAVPELDEEAKTASITFFVDPRNRVYVRRINFNGADNVNDEVFRREMRQLEGGYLSNSLIERSKLSLQQLPYIEGVEHETTPVAGSPDLVDVDFDIEEGLPGQFGGNLGYSESYGVTLGGNFIHSNFMGTGRRVALDLRGGEYQKVFDVNFTDPYRNIDGVSRTISLTYQDLTQFTSATSDFSTTTLSAGMNWGYPVANFQRLTLGFAYQDSELLTSTFSSRQALEWVSQNGEPFLVPGGFVGTKVKSLDLVSAWQFVTLNAGLFSTGGVDFFDKLGDPIDYSYDYDKLKKSVGLGVEWLAPLGLLRFSYAMPLNEDDATDRFFGDEVERFQFSIGNAF